MRQMLRVEGREEAVVVDIEQDGDGFVVVVDGQSYRTTLTRGQDGRSDLVIDGRRSHCYIVQEETRFYVSTQGTTWLVEQETSRRSRRASPDGDGGMLSASMPGLVLDVLVEPGAVVAKGDTLVLLEAMKMELRITAPDDGVVSEIYCRAGEVVERGRQLLTMERADA